MLACPSLLDTISQKATRHTYVPCPALQSLVSTFVIYEHWQGPDEALPVRPFPPHPGQCLYFYPHDTIRAYNFATQRSSDVPRSLIAGPQLVRINLLLGCSRLIIKVGFRPGGLFRLFGVPLHEWLDQSIATADLWPTAVREMEERLSTATAVGYMRQLVEALLLRKLRTTAHPIHPLDKAAELLLYTRQPVALSYLANQTQLSLRQFERRFRERIGMCPRLFARLKRFATAFELKARHPGLDWHDLAHLSGYFDQAHLIHDYRLFTGVTPSALLREEATSPIKIFPADLPW